MGSGEFYRDGQVTGRAFMIYGPESSGNRLLRRILIDGAGCAGDRDLEQRFDQRLPLAEDEPLIVWGRSVPGMVPRGNWPRFYDRDVGQARKHGYEVFGLVLVRDWCCMVQSQVDTEYKAGANYGLNSQAAMDVYTRIFDAFERLAVSYMIVSYEALVMRPERFVRRLFRDLGLDQVGEIEAVYDGNAKYYERWANPNVRDA